MSPTDRPRPDATQRCRPANVAESSSNIHDLPAPAHTPPPVGALPRSTVLPQVPGYRVLEEVGRGGMGVVYKAVHEGLKRTVALKMIPPDVPTDAIEVVRFYAEAEVVAAIQHPNVVQVFEFSQVDGRPYMAMEYLPGGTLSSRLTTPTSVVDAAALVELLARAVQAAHEQGVVHRDLKPGNVLFDAEGQPRITDFGLAKRVASNLTRTQAVMGTPAYMAPEQASGRTKYAGPAADIYALGVILYECLVGEPPCGRDGDSWEIINRVLFHPVPPPRTLRANIPADLERVCLKCLEKDPAFRYTTAAALADDLLRFLRHEPVSVRPPGRIERAARWAKRRPAVATAYALGTAVFALVVVGSVVTSLWWKAVESQRKTETANAALMEEQTNTDRARREAVQARDQLAGALANETQAREQLAGTQKQLVETKYFHEVSLAYREAIDRNTMRADRLLKQCPESLRGWAWWHTYRTIHPEIARFTIPECHKVGFSTDPQQLVTLDLGRAVILRDATNGRVISEPGAPRLHFKANNLEMFAISTDGTRILETSPNPDHEFDPNRKSFVKHGTARLWDRTTGKLLGRWNEFSGMFFEGHLSLDHSTAIVHGDGQDAKTTALDLKNGKVLKDLPLRTPGIPSLSLSADGRLALVMTTDADNYIQFTVWEPYTGTVRGHFKPRNLPAILTHNQGILSPDGRSAAFIRNGGDVVFWTVGQDESTARVHTAVHTGLFFQMAYSPDSRYLATVGEGGEISLWSQGELVRRYHGHRTIIQQLLFDPASERLLAIDKAGEVIIWSLRKEGPIRHYPLPRASLVPGAVSDDGGRMALASSSNPIGLSIHDRETNTFQAPMLNVDGQISDICFQPGGKLVAVSVSDENGSVELRDGQTGDFIRKLPIPRVLRFSTSFSQDGRRFVAVQPTGDVKCDVVICDVESGEIVRRIPFQHQAMAALSGDGKRVAIGNGIFAMKIYDVDSGREIAVMPTQHTPHVMIRPLALNHDGSQVAHAIGSWQIQLANVPKTIGEKPVRLVPHHELAAHSAGVTSLAFNAAGDRLVSGSENSAVKVWDVRTGLEAIGLKLPHKEPVHRVRFSTDGQRIIAVGSHSGATVFDGSPRR
ncbi:MAG: protein kinase [Gemmataceae bacterium]|nr:protein kinase [Gemmataceae bacterium]